ncbi:MAG: AMP-binding protein, partial [Clostridium sp.]|nr:AMP-binding protein [Clostridium sp.]
MTLWNFNDFCDLPEVITEKGEAYSYRKLDDMQKAFVSHIKGRALVCMFVNNDIGSVVAYISCLLNRVVPILVPSVQESALGEYIIKEYQPDYIWISSGECESLIGGLYGYERDVLLFGYVLLRKRVEEVINLHPDLAVLLPTSGSTGKPKLVRLSYKNILSNTISICCYMKITQRDRGITSLPISYTYGLSVINTLLASGGSILLTKMSVVQPAFWRHMEEYGVTILAGVPYTFECMKKLQVKISELENLRLLTQAGGTLSKTLQKYWG